MRVIPIADDSLVPMIDAFGAVTAFDSLVLAWTLTEMGVRANRGFSLCAPVVKNLGLVTRR
jgi:hypothetical protein